VTRDDPRADAPAAGLRAGGAEPSPPAPEGDGAVPALPAPVGTWLASLARALQRYGLYPPGHPALGDLVEDLHRELGPLLEEEKDVAVAVAPDRLLYRGAWTDPAGPHVPGLAARLHEHDLAAIGFEPGVSVSELRAVLTVLRERPSTDEDRLGRRAGMTARWPHVWVEPRHYEKLRLDEELPDDERAVRDQRAARLWLGLARAVGAAPESEDEPASASETVARARRVDPARVARSLGSVQEGELLRNVGEALMAIAGELEDAEGEFSLRERFGGLFGEMDRQQMRRLLASGLEPGERREILGASSSVLATGPLLEMVETTSDLGDIDVSHWMLRILVKLAGYADAEGSLSSPEAQQALRTLVEQAVTGWGEEARSFDEAYGEALRIMAGTEAGGAGGEVDEAGRPEPLRVLQTTVEVDELGGPGERAFLTLCRAGRVGEVLALSDEAPEGSEVADTLRERLLNEEVVEELAGREPPDLEALERIARHVPRTVAGPLLEILETSKDRSVRGKAFSILEGIGASISDLVVARLQDERWYVQRNMLALLFEMEPPRDFSARQFTTHERVQVRREAYKHLLRDPETREDAVRMTLRETDSRTLTLGLGAVDELEDPASDLVPLVSAHAADDSRPQEVRVQAVRAVGHLGGPDARRALVRICERRHPILFWRRRLAPPSGAVREAVATLARRWPRDPAAQRVLRRAADSENAGLRKAARLAEAAGGGERTEADADDPERTR